jgi:rhamnogalacturonyl hydrolase YesR
MTHNLRNAIRLVANATVRLFQEEYENQEPEILRWDWQPGVGLYGLMRAYEVLVDKTYLEYVKYYVDRLLEAGIVSYSINGAIVFEAVLKLLEHDRKKS